MATTRKIPAPGAARAEPARPRHADFEQAIGEFVAAVELLHARKYEQARERFLRLAVAQAEEAALAERARTYARVCERRLAPPDPEPNSPDERYHRAVALTNDGRHEAALALLDRLLEDEPGSVRALYARASAWALRGNAEAAVADLRRAIGADARVLFQAVNDPDFEPIREEPVFIDLIEPSPAGS